MPLPLSPYAAQKPLPRLQACDAVFASYKSDGGAHAGATSGSSASGNAKGAGAVYTPASLVVFAATSPPPYPTPATPAASGDAEVDGTGLLVELLRVQALVLGSRIRKNLAEYVIQIYNCIAQPHTILNAMEPTG